METTINVVEKPSHIYARYMPFANLVSCSSKDCPPPQTQVVALNGRRLGTTWYLPTKRYSGMCKLQLAELIIATDWEKDTGVVG